MAAIDSSIYNTITIESFTGNSVDIRLGVVSIDFFEDVFCPAVSARIAVMTSGGSLKDEQGVESSLYEALKIRGGEPIRIYIEANTSENKPLDYLNKPMYVRGVSGLIREGNKEFFQMHCVSREGYEDTQIILQKRYKKDNRLDQHVKDIIEDSFIDPGKVTVDTTINKMGFCGNNEHPFAAITRLASKAVPQIGGSQQTGNAASAGFFFWQTTEGFNFRSIDALVKEKVSASYFASDVNHNHLSFKPKADFQSLDQKILSYNIERNNDMLKSIQGGAYATTRRFFDPITQKVSSKVSNFFTGQDYIKSMKNLGEFIEPAQVALQDLGLSFTNKPAQVIVDTYDVGTLDKDVNTDLNSDIGQFLSQRKMRYNTILTQRVKICVPLNTNLNAGKLIEISVPKITTSKTNDYEQGQISGIYMIKELNHHYDTDGSFTTMKLVRDTYGTSNIGGDSLGAGNAVSSILKGIL
jgi:hypothetical protein